MVRLGAVGASTRGRLVVRVRNEVLVLGCCGTAQWIADRRRQLGVELRIPRLALERSLVELDLVLRSMLLIDESVPGSLGGADQLIELDLRGFRRPVWLVWMANTMRNVTIVVPVLITSCQVSEKPKSGPMAAQTMTTSAAAPIVQGVPAHRVIAEARRSYGRETPFARPGAWRPTF